MTHISGFEQLDGLPAKRLAELIRPRGLTMVIQRVDQDMALDEPVREVERR